MFMFFVGIPRFGMAAVAFRFWRSLLNFIDRRDNAGALLINHAGSEVAHGH